MCLEEMLYWLKQYIWQLTEKYNFTVKLMFLLNVFVKKFKKDPENLQQLKIVVLFPQEILIFSRFISFSNVINNGIAWNNELRQNISQNQKRIQNLVKQFRGSYSRKYFTAERKKLHLTCLTEF